MGAGREAAGRAVRHAQRCLRLVLAVSALLVPLAGEAAQARNTDPWQALNRPVYRFNKFVDRHLLRPVAVAYRNYVPGVARTGVRNFFNNLDDVNVLANDILQLKMRAAANDAGRLAVNTTLGLGGLFDVATGFGWEKNYEYFGQTLGYWGVGDGGYLVLPLLGPSTLRDAVAMGADYWLNPVRLVRDSSSRAGLLTLDVIDTRVAYLPAEELIRGDEYVFVRNAYLQRRDYLVADGRIEDDFDDF